MNIKRLMDPAPIAASRHRKASVRGSARHQCAHRAKNAQTAVKLNAPPGQGLSEADRSLGRPLETRAIAARRANSRTPAGQSDEQKRVQTWQKKQQTTRRSPPKASAARNRRSAQERARRNRARARVVQQHGDHDHRPPEATPVLGDLGRLRLPWLAQVDAVRGAGRRREGRRRHRSTASRVEVRVAGPGPGRESAVRALNNCGLKITSISDVTPIPHNGCRPPKKRRV